MADEAPHADADVIAPALGARALELFGLSGLTLAQPVLSTMGSNPLEFISRRAGPLEVIAFALFVVLAPTVLFLAVEQVALRVAPRVLPSVHASLLGLLAAFGVLQIGRAALGTRGVLVLLGGIAAGAGFAMAAARREAVRRWLHYLAPFPLLFVAAFLFASPVSTLVFRGVQPVAGVSIADDAPPVVMIMFDEMSSASLLDADGAIDTKAFPSFARLASMSTRYADLTAASSWTNYAVPAILSGKHPDTSLSAVSTDHPENLFTLLADGYDLNVWEGTTQLCPPNLCEDRLAPPPSTQRIGELVAAGGRGLVERSWPFDLRAEALFAEGVAASKPPPEIFSMFRASFAGRPRSTLHYLHVPFPHSPWQYMPSGARHDADFLPWGLGTRRQVWGSDLAARAAEQAYRFQLRDADRELGATLDELERQGLLDEALVVVASDHGVAFEPDEPYRGATPATMASVGYPLLMIKAPHQTEGTVDHTPHQMVDALPLMMAELGVSIPWTVDGSVAGNPDGGRRFYQAYLDELPGDQGGWVDPDVYAAPVRGPSDLAEPARSGTLGSHPELIGEAVSDLPAGLGESRAITWLRGAPTITSPNGDGRLPATVEAVLDQPVDGEVAVAVDGVVVLTLPPSTDDTGTHVYGLIPETVLTPGQHELALFVIVDDGGTTTLRPIAPG